MSLLKEKLKNNEFVITAELCPPKGADIGPFREKARYLKGKVDAVNVTDNQRAIMRLGALPAAIFLKNEGVEPVYQVICRDKNRIAIQSDLLGASAFGIDNVLALTGDMITSGDHQSAKPVFDIESVELIKMITSLNQGRDYNGTELKGATNFFIGTSVNPGSSPIEPVLFKFEQKIIVGAEFFQTQAIFENDKLESFMAHARNFDTKIIAGILLLKSARMAHFLNENVPGVKVPDLLIQELENAESPIEKGIEIAARQLNEFRKVTDGVHIMCIGSEEKTVDIIEKAKTLHAE
ncbi:MAG: methylenetetrahydrofolate reductase [Candidatus Ancaeobacter aquaticus]|nr:methylenetetrahydrofolate reductase [Candidatus Ancaeobacter aquaticus]